MVSECILTSTRLLGLHLGLTKTSIGPKACSTRWTISGPALWPSTSATTKPLAGDIWTGHVLPETCRLVLPFPSPPLR